MLRQKKLKLKAYSLLEILVTLVIFAILTLMLIETLLLNLRISRTISNRTRIRSELNELVTLIERDIRNASFVNECDNNNSVFATQGFPNIPACNVSIPSNIMGNPDSVFVWVYNASSGSNKCNVSGTDRRDFVICKVEGTSLTTNVYKTSNILKIESVTFDKIIDATNPEKATLLVTITASARDPSWNISNQVRQVIVSTRNYRVNLSN